MHKGKIYLSYRINSLSQDKTSGVTRMNVYWYIDFSRLPKMSHLFRFLEDAMKPTDWNDIHPSFSYYSSRHEDFWFETEAIVKCSKDDKYDETVGYRIAFQKSKKKAYRTYLRFINTIGQKLFDYYNIQLGLLNSRISLGLADLTDNNK